MNNEPTVRAERTDYLAGLFVRARLRKSVPAEPALHSLADTQSLIRISEFELRDFFCRLCARHSTAGYGSLCAFLKRSMYISKAAKAITLSRYSNRECL